MENPFKNVILPAEVLKDGEWRIPFTKEQYDAVTEYLETIDFLDSLYISKERLGKAEKSFERYIEKASLRIVDDEDRQLVDYKDELHTLEGFAKECINTFRDLLVENKKQ